MKAPTKRMAFISVMGVLFAGALAMAFWPRAVPVDLVALSRGDIIVSADGEGKARVRDVFVVSSPIAGRLARVALRPGDPVEAQSTILASIEELDPSLLDARTRAEVEARLHTAEAALSYARAEVDQAQAQLDFANEELRRRRELHARGATTTRALEEAEMAVRTGEARLASTQAGLRMRVSELDMARASLIEPGSPDVLAGPLCCVPIRAPVDGRILAVLQESETVVQAGTPLMEVGDPDDLEVIVDLPSRDAVMIEPGASVVIDSWGGDALAGVVRRIEPTAFTRISALGIEEQRVNILIDIVTPSDTALSDRMRLGHGYRVMARITIDRADDVLRLPVGALFRENGLWTVFAVEQDRAVKVQPDIGLIDGRYAEVRSGLAEGAWVILHPGDLVNSGTRVTSRETASTR